MKQGVDTKVVYILSYNIIIIIFSSFRDQDRIYDIVSDIIQETPKVVRNAIGILSSLSVIAAILFMMG